MESIGKIKALADNIRLQAGFCETLGYLKFWSEKWVFKDTQYAGRFIRRFEKFLGRSHHFHPSRHPSQGFEQSSNIRLAKMH